jgi:hypothetical protein
MQPPDATTGMTRSRFYFLEPSKVGSQHITLIEGWLRALASSDRIASSHDLVFCASASTYAHLSDDLRSKLHHKQVPVMAPERRRLVRKSLLEFYVVMRALMRLRPADVLFVSCVLPTTLLMLELANRVLRRSGLFVSLHGEIEGLFDPSMRKVRNYGFWAHHWMRLRRSGSTLRLVVIDDFIKQILLQSFPGKLDAAQIVVAYHPVTAINTASAAPAQSQADACFIGYRTKFKGFDQYAQLADALPDRYFVAIGGGKVEGVPGGARAALTGNADYMAAIGGCTTAVFPYVGGYTCSLSAAVLDALSAGAHVLATPRACFVGLAEHFGADVVTLYTTQDEAKALLGDSRWLADRQAGRPERLQRLDSSRYGMASVRQCFENILQAMAPAGQSKP